VNSAHGLFQSTPYQKTKEIRTKAWKLERVGLNSRFYNHNEVVQLLRKFFFIYFFHNSKRWLGFYLKDRYHFQLSAP